LVTRLSGSRSLTNQMMHGSAYGRPVAHAM
jgi:hypothetical protein